MSRHAASVPKNGSGIEVQVTSPVRDREDRPLRPQVKLSSRYLHKSGGQTFRQPFTPQVQNYPQGYMLRKYSYGTLRGWAGSEYLRITANLQFRGPLRPDRPLRIQISERAALPL